MELTLSLLLFIFGLIFIIIGGNILVKNAIKISKITGVSEIIIGATIVSLATTLPELSVTIFSSASNLNSIAVGNAIGSVIFNLTFILGLCLFFMPHKLKSRSIRLNFYLLSFCIVFLFILGLTNNLNAISGIFLLLLFVLYFSLNIYEAYKKVNALNENVKIQKPIKINKNSLIFVGFAFIVGAGIITFGAKLLVSNGERLASLCNISEHVIGVTIIAIGTSLPELVTAISSIKYKSTNIAVGNTLGANVLSTTLLIGTASIINKNLQFNMNILFLALPLILLSMFIIYIPVKKHQKTFKWQGIVLLLLFFIYYSTLFFW